MKPENIERWGRWVRWHTPVLAWPFRRLAVKRLSYWRLTLETLPHLIAVLESPDANVSQTATQALGDLSGNPVCVDVLCAAWAKGRHATLGKIIAECHYQATAPVELRVLSGLQAGRLDELAREGEETVESLVTVLADSDAALHPRAEQVLRSLSNPKMVDALCSIWAKGRDATLGKIIAECHYQATAPVELRVLSGLQAGRLDELAREGAEAVPPLVAALAEKDKALAANARQVLETFASSDTLVDYALYHATGAVLLPIINASGLRHSIEGRWLLYLALAGRFDDYLAADFEFQSLRAEFRAAPPEVQTRIRESIVHAGDMRMNPLFVAEKKQTLLADLSSHDADLLVKVNARNQNWDALFKFLWVLPARHIRDAVSAMSKAAWQPEDTDRQALLHKLTGLVETSGAAPKTVTAPVLLNPVLQQWLARGETEWAKEPEGKLRERLKDEIPPPEQIAALGALRAQGQLTAQVLHQAGRSPQWLVRLVAAALGGQAQPINDGGKEWFTRLQTTLDAESVWGLKPCHVTRDGLEALQEGLARLPDRRVAGGLNLLEAVVAHYTAHDIEIEVGARVVVGEDSFEIGG